MEQWENEGLRIAWVALLLDNQNEGNPTVEGALNWRDQFNLHAFYVVADPSFSMVPGSSVGTPQLSLVDPRTMKVVDLQEGASGNFSKLTNLATVNKIVE